MQSPRQPLQNFELRREAIAYASRRSISFGGTSASTEQFVPAAPFQPAPSSAAEQVGKNVALPT
jgi:hypothetical protein